MYMVIIYARVSHGQQTLFIFWLLYDIVCVLNYNINLFVFTPEIPSQQITIYHVRSLTKTGEREGEQNKRCQLIFVFFLKLKIMRFTKEIKLHVTL